VKEIHDWPTTPATSERVELVDSGVARGDGTGAVAGRGGGGMVLVGG